MKKIGIFGGTFSPFHEGHLKIAFHVKNKLDLDEIWLIPAYESPSKRFILFNVSPEERYDVLLKTVDKLNESWLKVKDIEIKEKTISYTYKTIEALKEKNPKDEFFLIIGEISQWISQSIEGFFLRRQRVWC